MNTDTSDLSVDERKIRHAFKARYLPAMAIGMLFFFGAFISLVVLLISMWRTGVSSLSFTTPIQITFPLACAGVFWFMMSYLAKLSDCRLTHQSWGSFRVCVNNIRQPVFPKLPEPVTKG